jgi:probable HAF family extracellular repeat protein
MVDLDPTGLDDGAARFVTEDRGLIIGSIFAETGQRVFAWTKTTGLTDIFTLGRDMLPEYMNRQGALTGTVFREDGTSGAFFWSQANGLVDIGTLGDDFSWASDINSPGLVAGYSKIAGGDERAIAWSADGGLIDLGTLARSRSRGQFVTEAGAIIGVSGVKEHRTHAFVWTEADGLVEMPSLGRLENVDAASQCSRTHSHGTHFGQVGPGFGAVPGPHRLSRVLDGRGPRRRL